MAYFEDERYLLRGSHPKNGDKPCMLYRKTFGCPPQKTGEARKEGGKWGVYRPDFYSAFTGKWVEVQVFADRTAAVLFLWNNRFDYAARPPTKEHLRAAQIEEQQKSCGRV